MSSSYECLKVQVLGHFTLRYLPRSTSCRKDAPFGDYVSACAPRTHQTPRDLLSQNVGAETGCSCWVVLENERTWSEQLCMDIISINFRRHTPWMEMRLGELAKWLERQCNWSVPCATPLSASNPATRLHCVQPRRSRIYVPRAMSQLQCLWHIQPGRFFSSLKAALSGSPRQRH